MKTLADETVKTYFHFSRSAFVIALVAITAAAILGAILESRRRPKTAVNDPKPKPAKEAPSEMEPLEVADGAEPQPLKKESSKSEPMKDKEEDRTIYDFLQPLALPMKAVLQMAIGVTVVATVAQDAWRMSPAQGEDTAFAIQTVLGDVGVGLAISAAIELAYTLFTKGPDEALDPLMLAVSAAMIVEVSKDPLTVQRIEGVALLGALLGALFAIRLFIAESHHGESPKIWWVNRSR